MILRHICTFYPTLTLHPVTLYHPINIYYPKFTFYPIIIYHTFPLKISLKSLLSYIYIYIYIYAVINKDLLYLKDKVTEIVFIKGERKKFSKT